MEQKQLEQDNEYSFPYHYIPQSRDGFTQHYIWTWGKQYQSAVDFLLKEIHRDIQSITSIADVGCGDGRITKELAEEFNQQVVGIDYSSRAINLAKALNPAVNFEQIDIINGDVGKTFDAITLIEVFEHIPLDLCDDFAKALFKLLNKNGIIYLTVPHKNKRLSYKHFQHFSYESLTSYFKRSFEVESVRYIQKNDRRLVWLNKLLYNDYWIVNSKRINNWLYKDYKKKYFFANEDNCGRIYLKLRKL